MKKFLLSLLILALAGVGAYFFYFRALYNAYRSDSVADVHVQALDDDPLATAAGGDYSLLDMSLYGTWADTTHGLTYTVFTLDDAGDGFYWGKSWCVSDSVAEFDLVEHGNGWFRWRAKKDRVLFLHQTDIGFVVPVEHRLLRVREEQLSLRPNLGRRVETYDRVYQTITIDQ